MAAHPAEVPVMMGKRIGLAAGAAGLAQVGNGLKHAHLVGRTRATTGQ